MKKSRETKKIILDVTDELLRSRGYNGFSYKDISDEVGIRKASIHYHYPTKEFLVATFVRKQVLLYKMWAKEIREKSPKEKILAYRDLYIYLSGNGDRLCPVGVLSAEYPVLPSAVKDRMDELLELQLRWISGVLRQGMETGDFTPDISVPETAIIIFNTFAGLLKTSRVHHDDAEIGSVCRQLINLITMEK